MKRNENKEDDYFDKMLGFFAGCTNDPLTSNLRLETNKICVYDFHQSCYSPSHHPSLAFFYDHLRSHTYLHTHTHTSLYAGYVAIPSLHPTQHPSPNTLAIQLFAPAKIQPDPTSSPLDQSSIPTPLVAPFLIVVDSQVFCGPADNPIGLVCANFRRRTVRAACQMMLQGVVLAKQADISWKTDG